jgi:hypothetical protein
MTDDQSTGEPLADIFGLPPSKRECALITRIALLEARLQELEVTVKVLEGRNADLVCDLALARAML